MTPLGGRRWAIVYALLGLTIAAFALAHLVVVETYDVLVHQALYAVISVLASAAILYHAHRHRRVPFPASRYRRINAWLLATTFLLSMAGIVGLYVGSRRV